MKIILFSVGLLALLSMMGCQQNSVATTSPALTQAAATISATVPDNPIIATLDPNPVPVTVGAVHWKETLTETKGVGVTIKKIERQFYSDSGPQGNPNPFNSTSWFQNLPGAYLPAYGKGIIGAGETGGIPSSVTYAVDTITGTDDNGRDIGVKVRIDFSR